MTEEQIREIVRDEIEEEYLKEGGLSDSAHRTAFLVVQGVTELIASHMLEIFEGSRRGPN